MLSRLPSVNPSDFLKTDWVHGKRCTGKCAGSLLPPLSAMNVCLKARDSHRGLCSIQLRKRKLLKRQVERVGSTVSIIQFTRRYNLMGSTLAKFKKSGSVVKIEYLRSKAIAQIMASTTEMAIPFALQVLFAAAADS